MATVTVEITRLLAGVAGTERRRQVEADTAADALDALCGAVPALQVHVFDDAGQVRPHVNVFVRGEIAKGPGSLDVVLVDGDEVAVVQAVSGGCGG